jgi:uncharacterized protein DUF3658
MCPTSDIDQLLLSLCNERWLKVARIVGQTMQTLKERGVRVPAEEIDARMEVLIGTRQLEAKGNIRNWRYSEVRLPAAERSGFLLIWTKTHRT